MVIQTTMRNGRRCSTGKAFLRPVSKRQNLHIAIESFVRKILVNHATKKAVGVIFEKGGKEYQVKTRKEVIVSAGSINSPQLLMLSGIGPAGHLEELSLPVLANLSVGRNLQDHVGLGGLIFSVKEGASLGQWEQYAAEYAKYSRGPLTMPGSLEVTAFVKTKYADSVLDYPDIEFHVGVGGVSTDNGDHVYKTFGLSQQTYTDLYQKAEELEILNILPNLLRPKSVGYLTLNSTDPHDHPLIYPNYLTHPHDIKVLVEGIKIALSLCRTASLQQLNCTLYKATFPKCLVFEQRSDEYWECQVRIADPTYFVYLPIYNQSTKRSFFLKTIQI